MTIPYLHTADTKLMLQIKKDLDRHEGFREYAYPDPLSGIARKYPVSKEFPWGKVSARSLLAKVKGAQDKDGHPWTVGYGFTNGTTPDSRIQKIPAERMLEGLILEQNLRLRDKLPGYVDASFVTKTVLINMAFNMGLKGLLSFKNTLAFIKAKNYVHAAQNMKLSLWYTQVGNRAKELVKRMQTQTIEPQHITGETN